MSRDNDPWGDDPKTPKTGLGDWINNLLNGQKRTDANKRNNHNGQPPRKDHNTLMPNGISPKFILLGVFAVLILWALSGLYVVKEGYSGVELCFGKHRNTNTAGLYWNCPRPIGSVTLVDTQGTRTTDINTVKGSSADKTSGQMLTADENIVEVSIAVQYRVDDPNHFLFSVNNPERVLKEAAVSAIRETVGSSSVDYILIDGRDEWPTLVETTLREIMASFNTGIRILRVELRDSKAPSTVQDAFDDAVKAREEAKSYRLQAQAYANERIPLARGEAIKIIEKAKGESEKIIAAATGEATRFAEKLMTYQKHAPEITRDRMYLETLSSIYQKANNVVIDFDGNGQAPLFLLPLDGANTSSSRNVVEEINKAQKNYTFPSDAGMGSVMEKVLQTQVKEKAATNQTDARKKR